MTQGTSGRVSREKRGHIILLGLDLANVAAQFAAD
jgi:hypothetical protein